MKPIKKLLGKNHDHHPHRHPQSRRPYRAASSVTTRDIYCCGCSATVQARLTNGHEIYPHRLDLWAIPLWKCDVCGNSVGCHHKTNNRTAPLGCIPTNAIKQARKRIHAILDPLWKFKGHSRKELYAAISKGIGREYHTGNIRSIEEAENVMAIIQRQNEKEAV